MAGPGFRRAIVVVTLAVGGTLGAPLTEAAAKEPPDAPPSAASSEAGELVRRPVGRLVPDPVWKSTGGPHGGLGYDIRYSFTDPRTWYVTDAWAGFHLSTDGGRTWRPSNQGISTRVGAGAADAIPVFSATVDPHDPRIIWAGTQNSGDIYRSADGGRTWEERSAGIDEKLAPFLSFRGFTVDPRTSDIVYAMGEISSPGWTPEGTQRVGLAMDMTEGIVYRTADAGLHWQQIWRGNNLARYCFIDPRDPDVLYVSTGIFDREAADTDVEAGRAGGVGILKSTDGGQTWRVIDQRNGLLNLFVGSLYMNHEDPDVLLAAGAQDSWSARGDECIGGVFLTEDGGESWDRVLTGDLFSVVEFCTSDPDVAYAGSGDSMYRSNDRGRTWQPCSPERQGWGPPGVAPGFPIDAQCDPLDPDRLFINNYIGGNFLTEDGCQTWVTASAGYTGAQMRSVVAVSPGVAYAAGRTGPFVTEDGGASWVALANAGENIPPPRLNEIATLAVDPFDPHHLLATALDIGGIISRDGGGVWERVSGLPPVPPLQFRFAAWDRGTVFAALAPVSCLEQLGAEGAPPLCGGTGQGVWMSTDGGSSWLPLAHPAVEGRAVVALLLHPEDPDWMLVATAPSGLLATTDGGATFAEVESLSGRPVQSLAIDPSHPATVLAGLAAGGVWRSADVGATFSWSGAGLPPESRISDIAIQAQGPRLVFAADRNSGVYLSRDGGVTWQAYNHGLEHRTVMTLSLEPGGSELWAGVEGAGVWTLDVSRLGR